MFGDSDLGVFFDPGAFGVPVIFSGVTATGILDEPMVARLADRGFGGFAASTPSVMLPYNAFSPMPVETNAIMVNGQSYTVTERTAESDGAIIRYSLKVVL
jgi:hypothetical protein